jgi:hypothetical protein
LRQDLQDEQDGLLVPRIITFWRVSNCPEELLFILFILSKSGASTAWMRLSGGSGHRVTANANGTLLAPQKWRLRGLFPNQGDLMR